MGYPMVQMPLMQAEKSDKKQLSQKRTVDLTNLTLHSESLDLKKVLYSNVELVGTNIVNIRSPSNTQLSNKHSVPVLKPVFNKNSQKAPLSQRSETPLSTSKSIINSIQLNTQEIVPAILTAKVQIGVDPFTSIHVPAKVDKANERF